MNPKNIIFKTHPKKVNARSYPYTMRYVLCREVNGFTRWNEITFSDGDITITSPWFLVGNPDDKNECWKHIQDLCLYAVGYEQNEEPNEQA